MRQRARMRFARLSQRGTEAAGVGFRKGAISLMKAEAQRQHPTSRGSEQTEPQTVRSSESSMPRRGETPLKSHARTDKKVTEDSADSFPASDPPSFSPTTAGSPCPDGDDSCSTDDE